MKTKPTLTRIIEIELHRSKRNKKLGHAVAILLPCNHKEYLGIAVMKGTEDFIRVQEVDIIKLESYEVGEREPCSVCPPDEFWIDKIDTALSPILDIIDSLDMED